MPPENPVARAFSVRVRSKISFNRYNAVCPLVLLFHLRSETTRGRNGYNGLSSIVVVSIQSLKINMYVR